MKALILEDRERVSVREVEPPECSTEGLLLEVKACGVCGGDIRTFFSGFRMETDNRIMGHEIVGEVMEVGSGHREYAPGERLALAADIHCGRCYYCGQELFNLCDDLKIIGKNVPGGFAEIFHVTPEILERGIVNRIPEGLDYFSAALSEPLTSVLAAQDRLEVGPGSSVLIIGGGPIGCLHARLAKNSGAEPVVISEITRRRLDMAREILDIEALVNPREEDLKDVVDGLTGGVGMDIVIVACPSRRAVEDSLDYVRRGGRVDIFGGLPRDDSLVTLDSNRIHYEEIEVIGSFSYHPRYHRKALEALACGDVNAGDFISVRPMEGFASAVKEIGEGRHLQVILDMG